jgi:hypothetical protein
MLKLTNVVTDIADSGTVSQTDGLISIWGHKSVLRYVDVDMVAPILEQLHSMFDSETSSEGSYNVLD